MRKSPLRVFQVAYEAACRALPAHRRQFSPKRSSQPPLLACPMLKAFLRLDYRGLPAHLVQPGRAWTQAVRCARVETLLADAERVHKAVRSRGVRTIIPPKQGRHTSKPTTTGRWRRVMKQRFARLRCE